VEKSVKSVEKCGITFCILIFSAKSSGNCRVFPGFHRVFHRIFEGRNIQQLSTALLNSQMWDLRFVIFRISGVPELKLFTKNDTVFHANDNLCTGFPPEFSTVGGLQE
jgi:hypothetical protein